VSHELRTPLNAILGFSRLLRREGGGRFTAEQQEYIEHINASGGHLLNLIDDVLDLSLIETGRFSLSLEAVSFRDVLDGALAFFRDIANHKKVQLRHITQDFDDKMYVYADVTRLRQVTLNILSNAIKFNKKNGEVRLSLEMSGAMVYLTVSDTGKGISDENLIEIFEPFSRPGEDGYGAEGAGIGLSIVKQLTEMMNGTIEVDSRVGVGTRFSVGFPVYEMPVDLEPAQIETALLPLEGGRKAKILYIEDNQINMMLMQGILKEYSHLELFCAETGAAGIALALEKKPDLIFTDINLPDLSGYEVLEKLKNSTDTISIPVIAITASAFKEEIEKGVKAGFLNYMTKPMDANAVLSAIQENTQCTT